MFELAPFGLPADYGQSILSLADAKAHLRVLSARDDDLIGAFRDAAVDAVERYTGLILAPRVGDDAMVWRAEALPPRVRLGVRPITAITGFAYFDSDGAAQTIDTATLRVGAGDEVLLKPGKRWPGNMAGGIEITFEAGLPAGKVPASLLQAVRMFTAHLYLHREAVYTGTISGEIPLGFQVLCSPYRPVVI